MENANYVHIVYLLVKLCNIFGEAFFIDVSIVQTYILLTLRFRVMVDDSIMPLTVHCCPFDLASNQCNPFFQRVV